MLQLVILVPPTPPTPMPTMLSLSVGDFLNPPKPKLGRIVNPAMAVAVVPMNCLRVNSLFRGIGY